MTTATKLLRLLGSLLVDVLKGVMCVLLAVLAIAVIMGLLVSLFMAALYVLEACGVPTTSDNLASFVVLAGFGLTALVILLCRVRHHWKRLS